MSDLQKLSQRANVENHLLPRAPDVLEQYHSAAGHIRGISDISATREDRQLQFRTRLLAGLHQAL